MLKLLLSALLLCSTMAQAFPQAPNPPKPNGTVVNQAPSPYFLYDQYQNVIGTESATGVDAYTVIQGTKANLSAEINITSASGVQTDDGYNSSYSFNFDPTLADPVTYKLPTASPGLQKCYYNGNSRTGILTIQTSATGQYIDDAGILSATGGYVVSGGALGDGACFIGVNATIWKMVGLVGTWTLH